MCSSTLCRQTAVHMPTVSSQQVYIMLLTTGKTTHLACDGLMLSQRCGCWVCVHTTQGQCAVFVDKAGYWYILGRRGRFWERRIELLKREVYSGREGWILGGSHNIIVVEKGGIFREGGVDFGRVAYSC